MIEDHRELLLLEQRYIFGLAASTMASVLELPEGRQIAYELTFPTEPQRPTVILSNSLASQYRFWDDVVQLLHDAGFRVLRYDHPGHGQSTAPKDLNSTTFQSLAEDVYHLVTSKEITSSFAGHHQPGTLNPLLHAWIGVSMGAAVGIYYSVQYPGMVKNLVICDTILSSPINAGGEDVFTPRVKAARKDGDIKKTAQQTMERWFGDDWISAHPERAEKLLRLMHTSTLDGYETCIAALRSTSFDLRPLAPKMAGCVEHVLVVVGEKDADLPAKMKDLQKGIQGGFDESGKDETAGFVVIPKAGHLCFVDNLEDFQKAVMPFIST